MSSLSDLVGTRRGRLTITGLVSAPDRPGEYLDCQCDCGSLITVRLYCRDVIGVKSCGCDKRKTAKVGDSRDKLTIIGLPPYVVGSGERWADCRCDCGTEIRVRLSGANIGRESCGCSGKKSWQWTKARGAWHGAITRCTKPHAKNFHHYGGRGITVHHSWLENFEKFYQDMGPPPTPKHTLDRKDNDGNYEPGNCRWATQREQMNNTRHNVMLELWGERKSVTMWARDSRSHDSVNERNLGKRIREGWPTLEAVTRPKSQLCMPGEDHWQAKLTPRSVRLIRSKYVPYIYGYDRLAHEFNVSKFTVIDVVRRKTWAHV